MAAKKVMVVDDEQDIVELIGYNLRKEGYEVATTTNSTQAQSLAESFKPDVVILDVMMPEKDGFEVCRDLRSNESTRSAAIMFLTAKSGEIDQILGLELGADDYVQKPISPRVLTARIKSLLRRNSENIRTETIAAPEIIVIGGMEINRQNYTLKLNGAEMFLPKKEFELLAFLVVNKGKVFTRESLLSRIWGESVYVVDRTVDVHVSKIREKLGDLGAKIETVKGVGYRFRE